MLFASTQALAQPASAALADCAAIATDSERLTCFDRLSGRAAKPAAPAAAAILATPAAAPATPTAAAAPAATAGSGWMFDKAWGFDPSSARYDISLYAPDYFLVGRYTIDLNTAPYEPLINGGVLTPGTELDDVEAAFQLSFKFRAWTTDDRRWGAWVAYTQQSQWQLYNDSGNDEQKQRWLPRMASGELLAAIAMTEPGTGSDLQAVRTRAERQGEHYVINGAKTFITGGHNAGLVVIVCKTDATKGAKGTSLIVAEPKGLEGFRVGRLLDKICMKASDTAELFFDDMRVPVANLIGGVEGQGFFQLMGQLPFERTQIAVSAVAAAERALELTVQYTKERKAFGQPVFDFQNTRFKLAECATTVHVMRCFVNDCIQRLVDGKLDPEAAYMAKWWCSEQQCKVLDECLQFFGGYGYMSEYPIARMYANARVQKIYGGANEIMKDLISRKLSSIPIRDPT